MKVLNDVLSSAGLYMPPLLTIINKYAWQTYLENVPMKRLNDVLRSAEVYIPPLLTTINEYLENDSSLKIALTPLVDFYDYAKEFCDMTPRLLNALVQATDDNRRSILFRRTHNDGHVALLRASIRGKWRLKWYRSLKCYQNTKKRIVYLFVSADEDADLWLERYADEMNTWKIVCVVDEWSKVEQIHVDPRILRQCRGRCMRVS